MVVIRKLILAYLVKKFPEFKENSKTQWTILSQINPSHILINYFFKKYFSPIYI